MELDFDKLGGLIPAIIQDSATGEVLMLGFMNRAALEQTLRAGKVTFYSRSRQKLWTKGETSGHFLRLVELRVDCDADAVLARVELLGPGACHEGYRSCFFRQLAAAGEERIVAERSYDPAETYGGKRQ
jgi:phosphoribosyl-AMP cyclohydrolase